jgi:hypothetical protein
MTSFTGTAMTINGMGINISPGYDVFLVAGQSNCYAGRDPNTSTPVAAIDGSETDVLQYGRNNGNDGLAIAASEPLDFYVGIQNTSFVGWALTFAKKYKRDNLAPGRQVLLVPCAIGNTGFSNTFWNDGNVLDLEVKSRVDAAMALGSGTNVFKGILWHQGETDAKAAAIWVTNYQTNLLALIDRWRTYFGEPNLPFVVGGMVPEWVVKDADYQTVEAVIQNIPNLRSYTGYADPSTPTELTSDPSFDSGEEIHYTAISNRGTTSRDFTDVSTLGLAGRYYTAYLAALTNT